MPASPESQALWAGTVRDGILAAFGRAPDSDQHVLDALCWTEARSLGRDDDLTLPEERRAQAGDAFIRWAMSCVAAYDSWLAQQQP